MIQFVYFDVGGVVIRDFSGTSKWDELISEMGITREHKEEFKKIFDRHELDACTGRDIESFIPLFQQAFELRLPPAYSLLNGFVSRFEKNETIWPVIRKVHTRYKIGLLTNMYPHMLDSIYRAGLMPDVSWDMVIDSSVEKLRKPQAEIFEIAQKKSGYRDDEILFIDNTQTNVDAALKRGWQGIVYDPQHVEQSNSEILSKLLNVP